LAVHLDFYLADLRDRAGENHCDARVAAGPAPGDPALFEFRFAAEAARPVIGTRPVANRPGIDAVASPLASGRRGRWDDVRQADWLPGNGPRPARQEPIAAGANQQKQK